MKELIEGLKAQCQESIEYRDGENEVYAYGHYVGILISRAQAESLIDFYEQHHWRKVEDGLPNENQYLELEVIDGTGLTYISAIRDGKFCDGHGRYIASAIYWRPITRPK